VTVPRLTVDTLHHEIWYRPSQGVYVQLYVEAFGMLPDGAQAPEAVLRMDEESASEELEALYRPVLEAATCQLAGRFRGSTYSDAETSSDIALFPGARTLRRTIVDGESTETARIDHHLLMGGPFHAMRADLEIDCEASTVDFDAQQGGLTGHFGPAYATLIGTYGTMGERGNYWLRRIVNERDEADALRELNDQPALENVSPEVQRAVREAIEQAL
jgi:hypothetical protein